MAVAGDLTGQTLAGRYRVVSLLGEGAMGAVYLAEDHDLDRQVALKVLRPEIAELPDVRKRLVNECRILGRLGVHPNIVTLHDRLIHEGLVALVMEYVCGESLTSLIERTRQLSYSKESAKATVAVTGSLPLLVMKPADALGLADQCLAGLEFAHGKSILHRDVKPANIHVTRGPDGQVQAKLMDFGIGKAIAGGGEAEATALTMVGGPSPGTPLYMSPEQIDAQRFGPVGPPADLYAMGITLYQMLTLSLPFEGTYAALMHCHTDVEPPDPATRNPAIPPALRAVLLRALRKDPRERHQSAAQFRRELKAAGVGAMVSIAPEIGSTRVNTPATVLPPPSQSNVPIGRGATVLRLPGKAKFPASGGTADLPALPARGKRKWASLIALLFGFLILGSGIAVYLMKKEPPAPKPTPPSPTPVTPTPLVSHSPTPSTLPTSTATPRQTEAPTPSPTAITTPRPTVTPTPTPTSPPTSTPKNGAYVSLIGGQAEKEKKRQEEEKTAKEKTPTVTPTPTPKPVPSPTIDGRSDLKKARDADWVKKWSGRTGN